ncbi:MAG TPA: SMP-30/gluconolactonase/LRE family protein [Pseudonocardiaceae bacterium]|nr:SMP-30/gluconolactonase/LRE family protein [Pseudonocardiaceae bacterium]
MHRVDLVWAIDGRGAESPVWDAATGALWFADLSGGVLYRTDPSGTDRRQWVLPERVGSFGLCRSGRLVVALTRTVALFDPATGDLAPLTGPIDEPAGNRFNDGKVGPDGAFWVGTRDGRRDAGAVPDGNGCLYRVTADDGLEPKARGYATSNGLAWSPDGTVLYHSDSHNGRIDVWDFDPATGTPSNRRTFATLTSAQGRPDGAACDVDGHYWSAGISAARLNRFAPDGRLVDTIDMPCPAPTMPCFAGNDIYVTANARSSADDRFTHHGAGLFRLAAPVAGAPVGVFAD